MGNVKSPKLNAKGIVKIPKDSTESKVKAIITSTAKQLVEKSISAYYAKYKSIAGIKLTALNMSVTRSKTQSSVRLDIGIAGEVVTPPRKGPGPGPKKIASKKTSG